METGWAVAVALGVVLAVVVLVVVIWVVVRRSGRQVDLTQPPFEPETVTEHESHSLSSRVNDRWDALLRSWEQDHGGPAPSLS